MVRVHLIMFMDDHINFISNIPNKHDLWWFKPSKTSNTKSGYHLEVLWLHSPLTGDDKELAVLSFKTSAEAVESL